MDQPKPVSEMTDQELVREWNCIECDAEDDERSTALAAEMHRRHIDF